MITASAIILVWAAGTDMPPALRNFTTSRERIKNIEYVLCEQPWTSSFSEGYFYILGGDGKRAEIWLGDKDGNWAVDAEEIPCAEGHQASIVDHAKEEIWSLFRGQLTAGIQTEEVYQPKKATIRDYATIGMGLDIQRLRAPAVWESHLFSAAEQKPTFHERSLGNGRYLVEALTDYQGVPLEYRWYIDAKRGWNAYRIEELAAGELNREATIELQESNGVWFPKEFVVRDRGGNTLKKLTFSNLVIDNPDWPGIKPETIGIWPGYQVTIERSLQGKPEVRWYTGTDLVTREEFRSVLDSGWQPHPEYLREEQAIIDATRRFENQDPRVIFESIQKQAAQRKRAVNDAWAEYVARFCREHAFDEEQVAKAEKVLASCVERRDKVFRRIDTVLQREQERFSRRGLDFLNAKLYRLFEEVDSIFHGSLQPRLLRLVKPTQTQPARIPTGTGP